MQHNSLNKGLCLSVKAPTPESFLLWSGVGIGDGDWDGDWDGNWDGDWGWRLRMGIRVGYHFIITERIFTPIYIIF